MFLPVAVQAIPFIETNQKKVLVDGLTSLLAEVNRKPEDLDAILVTHEHRDHIHGVGVLARKYKLDVYANEKRGKRWIP